MGSPVHFISGLPRSGSTLLAALLRQNPRFAASCVSPVADTIGAVHAKVSSGELSVLFDDAARVRMLRGVFESYYGREERRVVFDTNRTWTASLPLLAELYPDCRVICCVREVPWILDSLERLRVKQPLRLSKLFSHTASTLYTHIDELMDLRSGLVGLPWGALRAAWYSSEAARLIVVRYESLAKNPAETLRQLYELLGEEAFEHDFQNVEFSAPAYDASLGLPGLHSVRGPVRYTERRPPVVPPEVFTKYGGDFAFWVNDFNPHGVAVL